MELNIEDIVRFTHQSVGCRAPTRLCTCGHTPNQHRQEPVSENIVSLHNCLRCDCKQWDWAGPNEEEPEPETAEYKGRVLCFDDTHVRIFSGGPVTVPRECVVAVEDPAPTLEQQQLSAALLAAYLEGEPSHEHVMRFARVLRNAGVRRS